MRRLWTVLAVASLACALTGSTVRTRAAGSFSFTTIDVPGATGTDARGINDAGQIVGSFNKGAGIHGFVRTAAGAFTTIDVRGAIGSSHAHGINHRGQIVGSFFKGGKGHGYVTGR